MKKQSLILAFICISLFVLQSCNQPPSTVTDIDGNIYNTVLIGDQCWMQENLKVTHYPNGDAIPNITDGVAWGELADNNSVDAYCYYDNDINSEYGALYTYAAAIADSSQRDNVSGQGICPDGWHMPTEKEWTDLGEYLIANGSNWDGSTTGEKTAKSLASITGWHSNDDEGNVGNDPESNNTTGFTGLPGGSHHAYSGDFGSAGIYGFWWSATENTGTRAYSRSLHFASAEIGHGKSIKSLGYSVRCIKNNK